MAASRSSGRRRAAAICARELVQRFLETAGESRELLVSLIERVELTADKEIIIKFRFAQLDETAENQTPQGIAPSHTA